MRWGKVVDHAKCIGCHACSTACKSENLVPLSVNRTYVKSVDVGTFPQVRRAFQVTRCNQCENAPCTHACPTAAMYARSDGIVDFDRSICIGCKACIAACPYDAIFINPDDHTAEKCNFCSHRIDAGLEPACVVVCPTEAILVGDLNDPNSEVAQIVARKPVTVRRPEKETHPKLFYHGAHQATLDPIAAQRPSGGLFMWSEQGDFAHQVTSGHPDRANSSAAALLSYDVPHRAPWDWRLALYAWTKSIAAGSYLVGMLLVLLGALSPENPLWRWAVPVAGGAFLALTGLVLVADLEQPKRFYMIFTRPQWKSWLVRGAFIIAAYALLLGLHFLASFREGGAAFQSALMIAGFPLAVMTASYTAYLFAQASARDLWQNPLLPVHFFAQALVAGAALLLMLAVWLSPSQIPALTWMLAGASGLHLLLLVCELSSAHPTAHARLAAADLTSGRYRQLFRASVALMLLAAGAPWLGVLAAPCALVALFAYEHAYIQAGQAVPLA